VDALGLIAAPGATLGVDTPYEPLRFIELLFALLVLSIDAGALGIALRTVGNPSDGPSAEGRGMDEVPSEAPDSGGVNCCDAIPDGEDNDPGVLGSPSVKTDGDIDAEPVRGDSPGAGSMGGAVTTASDPSVFDPYGCREALASIDAGGIGEPSVAMGRIPRESMDTSLD
jgi:hypothetical protein